MKIDLTYFTTGDKALCSGCGACQQACPFDALSMQPDEEGFLFPKKDLNKCTQCGLCERICPFPKPVYSNKLKLAYGGYVKDVEERKKSSSGAIFYEIAKHVITQGGIVYGAYLSPDFRVYHTAAGILAELEELRGSKYVQSATLNVFKEIKQHLVDNKIVYFCGTGCQVAGLKAYLRKDYTNLITSDLVCHGVPNQMLFDQHMEYLKNKFGEDIGNYYFRDNSRWGACEIVITTSGKVHKRPSYITSPYLNAFIKNYTLRYSCYNCPYAHIPRQGDITLADLWGLKKIAPSLTSTFGASFILINSDKGNEVWERISNQVEYTEVNLDDAAQWNHNIENITPMPEIRTQVFTMIKENGYAFVADHLFKAKWKERAVLTLKLALKPILKKLHILH